MMVPIVNNEQERLRALDRYGIIDTLPEREFDEVAKLAAAICGTPIALDSLIDSNRQWIKSQVGLALTEIARNSSFCAHAILQREPFIVSDAAADDRFALNPLVLGPPNIRFYAGVPLINPDGYALGTLCVIDHVPRELGEQQREALRVLGSQLVSQLELRKARATLGQAQQKAAAATEAQRSTEEFNRRLIACSRDCIKVLDLDAKLLFMNEGGMEALEICDLASVLNNCWIDFWEGEDRQAALDAVSTARNGGVGRFTGYFPTTVSRKPRWWDVVVCPIRTAQGNPERLLAVSRDITDEHLAAATFRSLVVNTSSSTGNDFFPSFIRHVALALHVRYAFITECISEQRVRTLAFWNRDSFRKDFEFDIAGTPCLKVLQGETCHYEKNVQQLFPLDTGLADWNAESYLGVPILDHAGRVIGHIAILDDQPMPHDPRAIDLVTIFAARAAAELRRQRAEAELQATLQRVQALETRHRTVLEINNAIISNLNQEALFQAISQYLREILSFDRIAIFLHDPQKDLLRLALLETASVPSEHFVVGWEIPAVGSLGGWVFQNQRPLCRRNLALEHEYPIEDLLLTQGFQSCVLVPLIVRGRSIGTLNLASQKVNQYLEAEVELLQEVGNQVALAIDNMKSYEEIARLKARLEAENVYLREEIQTEHNFEEIVGNSRALLDVLRNVETVAPTDATVLILGETGSGKELIARAIHSRSTRKNRPLVKVNCGAIPTGLVESELFGHMKGAFTGALERRTGRFELADRGTLFLDEISELPLETQVKLLRVLQEHEFEPLGSSRTIRVNVRIIAASNRTLEKEVQEGRFRADLYYRLNVVQVVLPPLRRRPSDIPLLAEFFLERFSRQFGKRFTGFSQDAMDALSRYEWPGNIRELQNVIERAVVLSPGPVLKLGAELLPLTGAEVSSADDILSGVRPNGEKSKLGVADYSSMEEMEKRHVLDVLRHTGWIIEGPRGAAKILDLHPNTLRSRMKKLGIDRSSQKPTTHEIS